MIKIVEINDLANLKVTAEEWNSLLNESTSTPFQTYEWITNYIKHFIPNEKLFLLLAYSDDELVGIAPLRKFVQKKWKLFTQKKIIFLDEVFSEYCDFIIRSESVPAERGSIPHLIDSSGKTESPNVCGIKSNEIHVDNGTKLRATSYELPTNECELKSEFTIEVVDAFINYIFANHPDIYRIDLRDIPLESKTGIALNKMNNILLSNFNGEKYLYIDSTASYQKYLSNFSKKTLLTIKRKENKISNLNVKYVYADKAEESHIALIAKLNRERIEKNGAISFFSYETNYKFLSSLVKEFNKSNITHLSHCLCNDETISLYLCFRHFNKLYFFISGFNTKYESYSLGSIHLFKTIEYCFKNNIAKFDFLRGIDKYKYRYHPEETSTKRSIIWRKSFMGRIWRVVFQTVVRSQ